MCAMNIRRCSAFRYKSIKPRRIRGVCKRIKYDSYMWNFGRLAKKFKYIFIERAAEEFKDDFEKGQ